MATQVKSPQISDFVENSSMARQAIMNGNFDVWQRGTTRTDTVAFNAYLADRFNLAQSADTGTLPTMINSRQIITPGSIPNSYYCFRLNVNGAGTGLGANSFDIRQQSIEYGTRNLAGAGKKVTVSFWARSSIVGKKIGVDMNQTYGTGGSPSSSEALNGTNWTLTSTWTKYTHTFTTNTLVGKTFGTADNDYLLLRIWNMWGSTQAIKVGAVGAETYVGSGDIDLAQVQLCAGDEALPFQPKSYGQEYRDCLRYAYYLAIPPGNVTGLWGTAYSTTHALVPIQLPVPMRTITSLTVTASDWQVTDSITATDCTGITIQNATPLGNTPRVQLDAQVGAGLTQFRPYILMSDAGGTRTIGFEGEL